MKKNNKMSFFILLQKMRVIIWPASTHGQSVIKKLKKLTLDINIVQPAYSYCWSIWFKHLLRKHSKHLGQFVWI